MKQYRFKEEKEFLEQWNKANNWGDYDMITDECLDFIIDRVYNEVEDDKTGVKKRDTLHDKLITDWFYNKIKFHSSGRVEETYDGMSSGRFIKNIEQAIETSNSNGDNSRAEKLNKILEIANQLKTEIERKAASKVIHNYRYQGSEERKSLVEDEVLLSNINRFFKELELEASAGYALNNTIYVYLTNAKDKNDLLKRMEVVSSKLEEYEKNKSPESIGYVKGAADTALEDFESGDILGIDENVK